MRERERHTQCVHAEEGGIYAFNGFLSKKKREYSLGEYRQGRKRTQTIN